MNQTKIVNLITCSVLPLMGCTETGHECEATDMMAMYRIITALALALCLLLAYFLWRSYKYNKVLSEKYERLDALCTTRPTETLAQARMHNDTTAEPITAEPTVQEPSMQEQLFRRLCQLMDGPDQIYTDSELDRSRLAKLLGTNVHYVSDAVSACTSGGSIIDFLNGYRLRHAVHLLSTTKDSIGLIAELSGFSRRSFYRVFDEAYHISPSEFRKTLRK